MHQVTLFIYRIVAILGLVFALAACTEQGPMEEAGEQLDEAAQEAQNVIEDSCENIKEGMNAEDEDC